MYQDFAESIAHLTFCLQICCRNLFLGYYVPYRHTIPLWEMETDYYLHNRHIEMGKGMRGYQKVFGVSEWNCEDDCDTGTDIGIPVRHRSQGSNLKNDALVLEHQSQKIQRVRDRCSSQNKALSNWWKRAIQMNVQQRMVSVLPCRFLPHVSPSF
jgi:hypothetical protein